MLQKNQRRQHVTNIVGIVILSTYFKISFLISYIDIGLVLHKKSYIRNSSDFANKRRNLQKIYNDVILVTADVVSLYSVILHDVILKAVIYDDFFYIRVSDLRSFDKVVDLRFIGLVHSRNQNISRKLIAKT